MINLKNTCILFPCLARIRPLSLIPSKSSQLRGRPLNVNLAVRTTEKATAVRLTRRNGKRQEQFWTAIVQGFCSGFMTGMQLPLRERCPEICFLTDITKPLHLAAAPASSVQPVPFRKAAGFPQRPFRPWKPAASMYSAPPGDLIWKSIHSDALTRKEIILD